MNKQKIDLPDGTYKALWSAYTMKIINGNEEVYVDTVVGVKGINCKVLIEIVDGVIKDYKNG